MFAPSEWKDIGQKPLKAFKTNKCKGVKKCVRKGVKKVLKKVL